MGRLIDADDLLKEFEKKNTTYVTDLWHITGIKAFIENAPTAYDVEKVIEQTHQIMCKELEIVLKPLPEGAEYTEEAYRILYLNKVVCDAIRNGGKE